MNDLSYRQHFDRGVAHASAILKHPKARSEVAYALLDRPDVPTAKAIEILDTAPPGAGARYLGQIAPVATADAPEMRNVLMEAMDRLLDQGRPGSSG